MDVAFTGSTSKTELKELSPLIDRPHQTVRSSTRELALDYGKGLLTIDAGQAQGASGNLSAGGAMELGDITIQSSLDNAHLVLVSLDGSPLKTSRRMLLQVMSEEQATGFATENAGAGVKKITNIGRDPWRVKSIEGTVRFKSGAVQIQSLDFNGYPQGASSRSAELKLDLETIYYLVTR